MSVNAVLLSEIHSAIRVAYGSLSSPQFSFVTDSAAKNPYGWFESKLKEDGCVVTQDTDLNDDVSFGYIVARDRETLVARISMVGPFGVVLRGRSGGRVEVLKLPQRGEQGVSELERSVLTILGAGGVTVLGGEVLSEPIELQLYNTAPSDVCIFSALFTDGAFLPWEP